MEEFVVAILGTLAFIVIVGLLARRGNAGLRIAGPVLALRRFEVNGLPDAPVVVDIRGRASGLVAWLLTVARIDNETCLVVTRDQVWFQAASLYGQTQRVVPLLSVASTHCGYRKPLGLLVLGIFFLLVGILAWMVGAVEEPGAAILLAAIGGGLLVMYKLRKSMTISLETHGGTILGLNFKRSVIEGVGVSMEQAEQAIQAINNSILASQRPAVDIVRHSMV